MLLVLTFIVVIVACIAAIVWLSITLKDAIIYDNITVIVMAMLGLIVSIFGLSLAIFISAFNWFGGA